MKPQVSTSAAERHSWCALAIPACRRRRARPPCASGRACGTTPRANGTTRRHCRCGTAANRGRRKNLRNWWEAAHPPRSHSCIGSIRGRPDRAPDTGCEATRAACVWSPRNSSTFCPGCRHRRCFRSTGRSRAAPDDYGNARPTQSGTVRRRLEHRDCPDKARGSRRLRCCRRCCRRLTVFGNLFILDADR